MLNWINVENLSPLLTMNVVSTTSPLSLAIDRYLMFLQAEQNKSPLTITSYRQSLDLLLKLCPMNDPLLFNKQTIRIYKTALHSFRTRNERELSIRTKNHHLTILRAFLRYLIQEEEMNVLPPDRIQRFKEEQRKVKVLFHDELQRLLSSPDTSQRSGKRDKAILELFFSTGMRLAELRSINRTDLNYQTREISVRGKRGKVRVVFLSEGSIAALKEYVNARLDHLQPLFITHHEKAAFELPPGEKYRMSANMIYRIVKRYAREAGILSNPSPHTLRHSFATDLLRNGADLRSVQELLGHKDLSTTQIYTHVTNPQLKEVHRKFHGK
ncbi:MAG: tyrosine-type recombinase/integrase [Candidatus Peregrinibacteria bacterium]